MAGFTTPLPAPLGLMGATIPVTTYTLSGPSSGAVGVASSAFTVALGAGVLASPVGVTPDDGGAGGTFSPTSVTLSDGTRSATFAYTPPHAGTFTISVADDDSLDDPPSLSYRAGRGCVTPTRGGR